MSRIDFSDELSVGLPLIDEQHKQLIALSNSLIQAVINGVGEEVLDEVFLKLRAYVCYHFADEEQYMKKIGYPQFEEHKILHKQLTADVDDFRNRLKDQSTVSPSETLEFVCNWIVKHIEEEDMKIGQYVESK